MVIAFIMLAAYLPYIMLDVLTEDMPGFFKVERVYDRLTDTPQRLNNIVHSGERIGTTKYSVTSISAYKMAGQQILIDADYFCANDVHNKIKEVSDITGVSKYQGSGRMELITAKEFGALMQKPTYCTVSDCVRVFYRDGDGTIMGKGFEVLDDTYIWRVSHIKTAGIFFKNILTTAPFILSLLISVMILYYTVVLYVIFGRNKQT